MRVWSFSSMNTYYTCPRQYFLTYVNPVIPYQETEATIYGSRVHEDLEHYIASEKPMREESLPYKKWGDKVRSMTGEVKVEQKMALTRNLEPCEFDDTKAWCRGIIDVLRVDGTRAGTYDWKTGKVRPDSDQLKLFAGFTFQHHPTVELVKTAYVWLKHNKTTTEVYKRDAVPGIWEHFIAKANKMEQSYEKDKWIPKPSGLCNGWCGAGREHCEFWSPKHSR